MEADPAESSENVIMGRHDKLGGVTESRGTLADEWAGVFSEDSRPSLDKYS